MTYFWTRIVVPMLVSAVIGTWLVDSKKQREYSAWPITETDYQKAVIYDLHPALAPYADKKGAHVHCAEELNGGGYRNGKFVYLKDVQ